MPDYRTILADRRGDVLTLTLNRPERLNALSLETAEELSAALIGLDGARAVLITGAGRAFCSGADLAARGERVCCVYQNGAIFVGQDASGSYNLVLNGTSFATPQVAGAVALVKALHPTWNSQQVKVWLQQTADKMPDRQSFGHGLLNVDAATR